MEQGGTQPEHLAVLDERGRVIACNGAWQRFIESRGLESQAENLPLCYADACERAFDGQTREGSSIAAAIRRVVAGEQDELALELPSCDSADDVLRLRVYRLQGSGPARVVIGHARLHTNDAASQSQPAEARLEQLTADVTAAKNELLSNVTHELRTPLNAVLGFAQLLLKEDLSGAQRQKAAYIHEAGRMLLESLDNIIEFSSLQAGQIELFSGRFDLADVVYEAVELTRPLDDQADIETVCSIDPHVPPLLLGDRARLRQVILNLLHNAYKFTRHGRVELRVTLEEQLSLEHVRLRIEVIDTGIGIPLDRLPIVFESFRQGDGSTTRGYGGTGLGLALSKRLIELMGGQIGLQSEIGHGSRFWFTLSLGVAHEKPLKTPRPRRALELVHHGHGQRQPGTDWGELIERLEQAAVHQRWSTVRHLLTRLEQAADEAIPQAVQDQLFRVELAARREDWFAAEQGLSELARLWKAYAATLTEALSTY